MSWFSKIFQGKKPHQVTPASLGWPPSEQVRRAHDYEKLLRGADAIVETEGALRVSPEVTVGVVIAAPGFKSDIPVRTKTGRVPGW